MGQRQYVPVTEKLAWQEGAGMGLELKWLCNFTGIKWTPNGYLTWHPNDKQWR